ncbi:hypothetical protein VA249_14670 [Vibrio alfacsensis]|nr:hypothetical protein [Vibrio alfacsensis]BBM64821.1 hypothetical protein VA249_14670 [Vibrio alfacsensis]
MKIKLLAAMMALASTSVMAFPETTDQDKVWADEALLRKSVELNSKLAI